MDISSENTIAISPRDSITFSKHCWICRLTDEHEDSSVIWLSPCRCQGTGKWVHQECLQRWIDEQQQRSNERNFFVFLYSNSFILDKVSCPQCHTEYIIVYPKQHLSVVLLDIIEHIVNYSCTFLARFMCVGCVYWVMRTYGAVTTMQIFGFERGLNIIEKTNHFFILICLPAIPCLLVYSRVIKWDETLLRFWRKRSDTTSNLPRRSVRGSPSLARLTCGGLMLPTIAKIFGKVLFQHVHSNLQRTVLGGITFLVLKGILKIYYKQMDYVRSAHGEILNYDSQSSS